MGICCMIPLFCNPSHFRFVHYKVSRPQPSYKDSLNAVLRYLTVIKSKGIIPVNVLRLQELPIRVVEIEESLECHNVCLIFGLGTGAENEQLMSFYRGLD